MMRLIASLKEHSRSRPAAVAYCPAGAAHPKLTWGELQARVDQLTYFVERRVPRGATLMLCYPNRIGYPAAFLGVLAAGTTVFPISHDAAAPEIQLAAMRSSAAGAIVHQSVACKLGAFSAATLPELSDDAVYVSFENAGMSAPGDGPALLLQSSGTTAEPRIVRRDARALDAVAHNCVRACGFAASDQVLAAVPLCHSYGMEHGLLAPVLAGSCVRLCEGFELPVALRALRGGITIFPGVPFMFEMLCRASAERFGSLRRAYSAGGPLPRSTFDEFQSKFGIRIGQVYGATEVGSVTFNDPHNSQFDPASVGLPMEAVSVKIVDVDNPQVEQPLPADAEGQIAIAAPSMLSGYIGEAALLIDGHFVTGDLGRLDAGGALTITGRLKLLIDVGGRKVNPTEIESVLKQHPGVGQCLVVPVKLSNSVSRIKAIITPASDRPAPTAQELRRFARDRLSPHKVPRVFEVRDTLPTSPAGKILRHLVEAS